MATLNMPYPEPGDAGTDHDHRSHLGEVGCEQCVQYMRRAARILEDLEAAERALRTERFKVRQLEGKIEKLLEDEVDVDPLAKEVYTYWKKQVRPKAKSFAGKRKEKVHARLREGYSVEDLKRAIDGAKVGAYTSPDGVRYDDLELICRDAVHVDRFMAKAGVSPKISYTPPEQRRRLVEALDQEYGGGMHDDAMGWTLYHCPSCADHSHLSLHILDVVEGGDWAWCSACGITQRKLVQALEPWVAA